MDGCCMYGFSRAIYRELAGEIVEDPQGEAKHENHERVLHACEAAVERLANDHDYFAQPVRTLFREIRGYFPMGSQRRVLCVIEHFMQLADEFVRSQLRNGLDLNGNPLQCRASTRRGTPCRRMPLPRNGYCPSHQHLAETEHMTAQLAA